ncbi:MAG: phosphomannomutase/phosphoglucomutase [Candidatus Diapherotrites archaeon]
MPSVDKSIFREYDIRGIAETQLNNEASELIGKAFGTKVKREGINSVCVGADNRLSSPRIKKAFIEGILSIGVNVTDIGIVPTPLLYYSIIKLGKGAGANVTASHNPKEFNGFKLSRGFLAFYGQEITDLYDLIQKNDFEKGKAKGILEKKDLFSDYLNEFTSRFNFSDDLRIAVDCGNGTGSETAKTVFNALNINAEFLFCESDGSFPNHVPDPVVEKNMKSLIEKAKKEKFDLGIGFDGDMDRIGVVDSKGRMVFGDQLLALYARDLLSRKPKEKIIFEVKCSQALIEDIEKHGGIPLMHKTGHSLIKKKMDEENSLLAGEMSGHMFFRENWFGFDDGLYAACKLIEIISCSKNSFDELIDSIPKFVSSPEIRVNCPDEKKFRLVESIKQEFLKTHKCITVDGVRVLFPEGWGLLRASNTQPKIILRFEAKTKNGLEKIKNVFEKKLTEYGFTDLSELKSNN